MGGMVTPIGPIRTQVDFELAGAPRGEELAQDVAANLLQRGRMAMPPTRQSTATGDAELTMTWGDFQCRHPEWRGDYWTECRALYAGGDRLLGDPKVLERLFPRHLHEAGDVYVARKARAHYFPYAGTIIDHLLAGLGTDALKISFAEIDDKGVATSPSGAEWWERWVTDVTDEAERPSDYGLADEDDEDDDEGGCTLHHFLIDALREALQTRTAWVLADLPPVDPDYPEQTAKAGAADLLDPYLCLVPAEQVIDWQTDKRGRLDWAIVMTAEQVRASPRLRRGLVLHTYVVWTADTWARYEILVDPATPPNADMPFQPVEVGEHGFGRVPIERLQLPEGMYAMGKLHSLSREHFNKRCAMSWAEYKSLFAVLYEFLGPEDKNGLPIAEAQGDANRAVNQVRGQGYTQSRGGDDRAEFVGPPVDPFVAARESCNDTMREMHRVMFSMALSADMDKAALQRSGESKEKDNASTAVLLDALGTILLKFCRRLLVLASLGRSEAVPYATITGLEKFDVTGTADAIAEAVTLFNGVPIKSALFTELYLARLYGDVLGNPTQEQTEQMREQIRESITAEQIAADAMILASTGGNTNGDPPGDGEDDGLDGPPATAPAPSKPKPPGTTTTIVSGSKPKKR